MATALVTLLYAEDFLDTIDVGYGRKEPDAVNFSPAHSFTIQNPDEGILETVFGLANHGSGSCILPPTVRSLSVGDKVAITLAGRTSLHLCEPVGWRNLGSYALDTAPVDA